MLDILILLRVGVAGDVGEAEGDLPLESQL